LVESRHHKGINRLVTGTPVLDKLITPIEFRIKQAQSYGLSNQAMRSSYPVTETFDGLFVALNALSICGINTACVFFIGPMICAENEYAKTKKGFT